eukprot:9499155-Pyramimonas_sp.AAC.1
MRYPEKNKPATRQDCAEGANQQHVKKISSEAKQQYVKKLSRGQTRHTSRGYPEGGGANQQHAKKY